jgi:hypothetical protein
VIRDNPRSLADMPTSDAFKKFSLGNATDRAVAIASREFSARMRQWRMMMTVFKTLIAAALISTATIPSAFAAWSFADQEPAAYASMYPNRDVLNGGALTPAGRMGLERAGGAAPVFAGGNVHIGPRHR